MKKAWMAVLACALAGPAAAVDSCWLRDAAAPSSGTIYALCEQGRLWTSTDGGAKWASRDMHAAAPLRHWRFWMSGADWRPETAD